MRGHRWCLCFAVIFVFILPGVSCRENNYNCSWERLEPYARLTMPEGDGPFPAIVLLHGCGGMVHSREQYWDKRLAEWGFASLRVDSFTPRGITGVCAGGMISLEMIRYRIRDAYLAKEYLAGLSVVSSDGIGVMGYILYCIFVVRASRGRFYILRTRKEQNQPPSPATARQDGVGSKPPGEVRTKPYKAECIRNWKRG